MNYDSDSERELNINLTEDDYNTLISKDFLKNYMMFTYHVHLLLKGAIPHNYVRINFPLPCTNDRRILYNYCNKIDYDSYVYGHETVEGVFTILCTIESEPVITDSVISKDLKRALVYGEYENEVLNKIITKNLKIVESLISKSKTTNVYLEKMEIYSNIKKCMKKISDRHYTFSLKQIMPSKKSIFVTSLNREDMRKFAWNYPRDYIVLRGFVERISKCFYDPGYKYCQKHLTKFITN